MTVLFKKIIFSHKEMLIGIFLFLLTLIVWFPTLNLGFFSDDYHFLYITEHQESVWKYFATNNVGETTGGSYGPVWNVLFTAQYALFGLQSVGYHVVTVLLYFGIAFLIYAIVKRLVHHSIVGVGAATLFITLHNHVSSVSWVAVQPHVFATFFAVVGLYTYMRFVDQRKWYWYVGVACSAIVSLFIKETAIIFPLFVVLVELLLVQNKPFLKRICSACVYVIPFVIGFGIFLYLRYQVVGYVAGYYGQSQLGFDIGPKLKVFIEMLVNMFASSPYRQQVSTWIVQHIFAVFIVGTLFVLSIFFIGRARWRQLLFVIVAYITSTAPFLSLGYNALNNGGERYSFFPSVFFVMMLAMVIFVLIEEIGIQKTVIRSIIFACVILIFVGGSLTQLFPKLQDWSMSSRIRAGIFQDFKNTTSTPDSYFLFVALPDNVYGAELFRNAIKEALFFETDLGYLEGERIMMFTELNTNRSEKLLLAHKTDSTYVFTPVDTEDTRIFTGFPVVEHQFGNFTLEHFSRDLGHSGDAIVWHVNTDAISEYTMGDRKLVLAYFDGQHMHFEPVQ